MSGTIKDRIQQRLEAVGLSARAASLKATGSDGTIRNILTDKSADPRLGTLQKLAPVLDTTVEWLLYGETREKEQDLDAFRPELIPGNQLVTNDRSLPVYPAAMGGDGHVVITFDPIEYVKRPTILEHVKDGYGVYIVGESMVPAYKPGETALIHPRHACEQHNGHAIIEAEGTAMIKGVQTATSYQSLRIRLRIRSASFPTSENRASSFRA